MLKRRITNARTVVEVLIPDYFHDKPRAFRLISSILTTIAVLPGIYGALPRQWFGRSIYRPYPND